MAHHLMPDIEFSENSHQRTPCVLVIDHSDSVTPLDVHNLNRAVRQFEQELKSALATSLGVQLLVIQVGGSAEARVACEWCDAIDFVAPTIEVQGNSPFLSRGIDLALDKIDEQLQCYEDNGIPSTAPWLVIISASDIDEWGWEDVAERCKDEEITKELIICPVGVADANLNALDEFTAGSAVKLEDSDFTKLFDWLARSLSVVSVSHDKVVLPDKNWIEA